jgi:hypothetical protein
MSDVETDEWNHSEYVPVGTAGNDIKRDKMSSTTNKNSLKFKTVRRSLSAE